jgi:hypothetical protein
MEYFNLGIFAQPLSCHAGHERARAKPPSIPTILWRATPTCWPSQSAKRSAPRGYGPTLCTPRTSRRRPRAIFTPICRAASRRGWGASRRISTTERPAQHQGARLRGQGHGLSCRGARWGHRYAEHPSVMRAHSVGGKRAARCRSMRSISAGITLERVGGCWRVRCPRGRSRSRQGVPAEGTVCRPFSRLVSVRAAHRAEQPRQEEHGCRWMPRPPKA